MPVFTHDRIDLASGLLSKTGVLWGGNAIQAITVGRHTPKNPQQAVGHLGVVDYTRGTITSDLSLDCILTEQTSVSSANTSIYKFADQEISVGAEEFVLTSCAVGFTAGNPSAVTYGYLTSSIASALAIKAKPSPSNGEESPFAVMLGDDGSGVKIAVVDGNGVDYSNTSAGDGVSYIDPADGTLKTMIDGGIPAGLQSLTFNARINHDNVLDVRSLTPVCFVATYPLDLVVDMELYILPTDPKFAKFNSITVSGAGRTYGAGGASGGFSGQIVKALSLTKVDEQETVSVGRYRGFTFNYIAADIQLPIEDPDDEGGAGGGGEGGGGSPE